MTENKYSWLDGIIIRIKQAYTEAHSDLGGSDKSTVEELWKRESEIIEEAKQAIIAKIEAEKAEARIDELEITIANMITPGIYEPMTQYKKDRIKELKEEA